MKCEKCGVTFDPSKKAVIGFREINCVEVKTKCPSCNEVYYGLVSQWFREDSVRRLLDAHRIKEAQ